MARKPAFGATFFYLGLALVLGAGALALAAHLRDRPTEVPTEDLVVPDRFVDVLAEEPTGATDAGEVARAMGEEGTVDTADARLKRARGTRVEMSPAAPAATDKSAGLLGSLESMPSSDSRYYEGGLGSRGSGVGGGGLGTGLGTLGTRGRGRGAAESSAEGSAEGSSARLPRASSGRVPAPAQAPVQTPPLRAAETDDNADFQAYLTFLEDQGGYGHIRHKWDPVDVSDRRSIAVVDGRGEPVPGAFVQLLDEASGKPVWSGTTYGDGRVPYYPNVATVGGNAGAGADGFRVEVAMGPEAAATHWDGQASEVVVEIAGLGERAPGVPLDVLFVLDTTGSMGDELDRIKFTLLRVTERLGGLDQSFDLRYGAVLYRDRGDDYVTHHVPFTGDLASFDAQLQAVRAGGGGDGPESLNQALSEAVRLESWRPGAARVAFLIADAPPHMDYPRDTYYGQSALEAVHHGIRIHAVAASGLDDFGTVVFRQVAQLSRGKFIFIEYDGTQASAASHGVTGEVKSNNLDEILYRQIADELEGWGRPSGDLREALVADAIPALTPTIEVESPPRPLAASVVASIAAPAPREDGGGRGAPPAWMWLFAVGLGLMLSRLIKLQEA